MDTFVDWILSRV